MRGEESLGSGNKMLIVLGEKHRMRPGALQKAGNFQRSSEKENSESFRKSGDNMFWCGGRKGAPAR